MSGVPEDQEVARSLLLGKHLPREKTFPRFRLKINGHSIILEKKEKRLGFWKYEGSEDYNNEPDKQYIIESFKNKAKRIREAYKNYYINL